jgi:hypothetical protein
MNKIGFSQLMRSEKDSLKTQLLQIDKIKVSDCKDLRFISIFE